jgi:hypothetical protein
MKTRLLMNSKGMMILESLFCTVILIIILIATISTFDLSIKTIYQAREIRVAADSLKNVVEKITGTAFSDITADFPEGENLNSYAPDVDRLKNSFISVVYPEGSLANTLEMEITISWTNILDKNISKTFKTMRSNLI